MKTVTSINGLIETLNEIEKESGHWIVYPKIGGYIANCVFSKNKVKINNRVYPFTNKNNYDESVNVLIAPDSTCDWLCTQNLMLIEMQTKSMLEDSPERVLEHCYFFTTDSESKIPLLPQYSIYDTLYELLNNLNSIDRNLRITDWFTIGLVIRKGEKDFLYIKPPLEAITRIKEISYNIGRTGTIIPIVKFDPVSFNGVLALQATLHNSKILSENRLQPNDIVTINIKRQGQQATEVSSVLFPFDSERTEADLSKCPSCNSTLIRKKRNDFLICSNDYCQEKLIRKILYWCSKEALDIKGLGIKYVDYMVRNKIIVTVDDIYTLTMEDLCKIPGILDKMALNIITEIDESRKKSLVSVFIGLGIEHLGRSTSKLLAWYCLSVHRLLGIDRKNINGLSSLMGKEQKSSLLEYLSNEVNREILLNLSRHLDPRLPSIKINDHIYHKKCFILKGMFPGFSRERIKNILTRAGIYYASPDNKEYDYCLFASDKKLVYTVPKAKHVKLMKLLLTLID